MWYVIQVQTGKEAKLADLLMRVCAESELTECFSPKYQTQKKVRGVRTKSWTGNGPDRRSACTTGRRWSCSSTPGRGAWAPARRPGLDTIAQRRAPREKGPRMTEERGLCDPPASGPLAGLASDQIENLLLRAVLADLKARGWDPASTSNGSKCELGERSGRETGLPLRCVTAFLRISRSSHEYHRARLGRGRDADIRSEVRRVLGKGEGAWGYRAVWARLRATGTRASEKRVRA